MQSNYSIEFHVFSDSSDTSCDVYPIARVAFMTVLAVHPEAILQGWLVKRPWILTSKLQYLKQEILTSVEGSLMYNLLGL